jgi:antitoxin component YwqK of YwqJK toxin-antitoxin module
MRTIALIVSVIATFIIASCGNNSSAPKVQHDTLSGDNISSGMHPDSIIKDGEYIKHYKNGVIEMRGMMKDGKRDGLWKSWYQDGLPWSETTFKEGKKEGPTVTFYDTGKKRYEGFYTADAESGNWTFYDEKGNVTEKKNFSK